MDNNAQVHAITQLLSIWPKAGEDILVRFVAETLGVPISRDCVRLAKTQLGLEIGQDDTLGDVRLVAEYLAVSRLSQFGFHGLSIEQLVSQVQSDIAEHVDGDTSKLSPYIDHWTRQVRKDLKAYEYDLMGLQKAKAAYRKKLDERGINLCPS